MISYSIAAAKNSKFIDKIVVSTDSDEIKKCSFKYGVDFVIKDPNIWQQIKQHLLMHYISCYSIGKNLQKFDFVIELLCVSPLRDHIDVDLH